MQPGITLLVEDDYAVVTCTGDLDLNVADDLRLTIAAGIRSRAARVVIDVSGTDLVDSTTLGVLLHANNACRDSGATLVIAGAPRIVARSMSVTGLDRVLTLARDVRAGAAGEYA